MNNLTGIAAILRFEMPVLQDMVDGEDEGDLDSDEDEGEIGASDAGSNMGSHGSSRVQKSAA